MSEYESYYISLNYSVAKRIRYLRESRNMTQKEVADHLEITRQAYSKIENGVTIINLDMLATLANVFQVKVSDFFPPEALNNQMVSVESIVAEVNNSPYTKEMDSGYIRTCDIIRLVSMFSLLPVSERETILDYLEKKTNF